MNEFLNILFKCMCLLLILKACKSVDTTTKGKEIAFLDGYELRKKGIIY
jgi:hypothetical protein